MFYRNQSPFPVSVGWDSLQLLGAFHLSQMILEGLESYLGAGHDGAYQGLEGKRNEDLLMCGCQHSVKGKYFLIKLLEFCEFKLLS